MNLDQFTKDGKFLMLALDHRGSFKKFINPSDPESVNDAEIIEVKHDIIAATENSFSGVLIDPTWGLPAFTSRTHPYLLCLEKTGYEVSGNDRGTELEYTAKQLKDWGAGGVKLLLYYNPKANNCAEQIAVAKKALEDSHSQDLPFFLEIVTYGNEEIGESRGEWVKRSLNDLITAGVKPEVWKLEYPGDKNECDQVNKIVGTTPWILLTRGVTFEEFEQQLQIATDSGASGFLAGRAVWQEINQCKNAEERRTFLNDVAKKRFERICEISLK